MKRSNSIRANYPFGDFPSYSQLTNYLSEVCRTYPHLATIEIIGVTTKKNEIYMIKLQKCTSPKEAQQRDTVFIDGTIHAREWLSLSSAVYCINYILLNHQILNNCNFYIVPCLNVDGYMFSREKKSYRLWRKNRSLNYSSDLALQGVDLNRNFPIGYAMPGSSDDPSSYNYRGEEPLSEPAAQALASAFKKYEKSIKLYISLHCYGNAILYPWSFTKDPIPDMKEMIDCARVGRAAFHKYSHGKRDMRIGSAAELMNLAAGTSTDYARYVHKIKFSYVIELEAFGSTGFTPHKNDIPQIGYEATKAIVAMSRHVHKFYHRLAVKQEKAKPKKQNAK